jgi:hypothetical protein
VITNCEIGHSGSAPDETGRAGSEAGRAGSEAGRAGSRAGPTSPQAGLGSPEGGRVSPEGGLIIAETGLADGGLAGRLAAVQRTLAGPGLDDEVRARFQRRLTAICDAIKAPGADAGRCARRLDLLLADLPQQSPPETPPGA